VSDDEGLPIMRRAFVQSCFETTNKALCARDIAVKFAESMQETSFKHIRAYEVKSRAILKNMDELNLISSTGTELRRIPEESGKVSIREVRLWTLADAPKQIAYHSDGYKKDYPKPSKMSATAERMIPTPIVPSFVCPFCGKYFGERMSKGGMDKHVRKCKREGLGGIRTVQGRDNTIMAYLYEHDSATANDIGANTGITTREVACRMATLIKLGKVICVKTPKGSDVIRTYHKTKINEG